MFKKTYIFIVIVVKGLSLSQAISRMKSRQDVWSKSKEFSRQVAAGANKSGKQYMKHIK